jgi:hypothetical protein
MKNTIWSAVTPCSLIKICGISEEPTVYILRTAETSVDLCQTTTAIHCRSALRTSDIAQKNMAVFKSKYSTLLFGAGKEVTFLETDTLY